MGTAFARFGNGLVCCGGDLPYTMSIMAAGASCSHLLSIAGGRLKECSFDAQRLHSCLVGIPPIGASLVSSTLSNGLLRRLRPPSATRVRRVRRKRVDIVFTLDTRDSTPEEDSGPSFGLGATRLKRIIQRGSERFVSRFNKSRKNFPTKIFLLLLGYYSANALATILGQTGDWDVLAAGILVALIEGIGYLMYRMPPFVRDRGQELVTLLNFYKSGFSFGLFVDAFKLGS